MAVHHEPVTWTHRTRARPGAALLLVLTFLAAACGAAKPAAKRASPSAAGVTSTATATATASPSSGAAGTAAPRPTPAGPSPTPVRTIPAAPVRTTAAPAPAAPPAAIPDFSHVVVIVMENEEYSSVIGNHSAPYLNSLAAQGALATNYYAVSHPSLPNYLALSGGSTFGVTSDCNPGSGCQGNGSSIADQLQAAHISWKAYMENLPACPAQSDAGEYAVRHDPFVYYPQDVQYCGSKIVPATQLSADIASGQLPQFAWLTPNVCDDMHDSCSGSQIAYGDNYLEGVVPQILNALGPDGAVFITFDEGASDEGGGLAGAAGGNVVMIAAGSAVRAGYRSSAHYDHYSLLATIESAWGLPRLDNAASAPLMTDLFS
jgi:hypothetical protein